MWICFQSRAFPTWFLVRVRPLPGSLLFPPGSSSWSVPYPVSCRGVSPPGSSSWRVPHLVPRRGVPCPVPRHGASPTRFLVVARPLPGSSSRRVPCPVPRRGASPCFIPSQLLSHSPPASPTGGYSMRQTFIPFVHCWVPAPRTVSGACEVLP